MGRPCETARFRFGELDSGAVQGEERLSSLHSCQWTTGMISLGFSNAARSICFDVQEGPGMTVC